MDDVAGLNDSSSVDVLRGIVYGITAFVLMVAAYMLFIRKYKRNKMVAVNSLEFITSRYNIYKENGQFLIIAPEITKVNLRLLNELEEEIEVLIDEEIQKGKLVYNFKVESFPNGIYFLDLKSKGVSILRKIKISH